MEQAKQFLARYRQAETIPQKQSIVAEYQVFLKTLTETQRDQAREVMSVLWPGIKRQVDELEHTVLSLEVMVDQFVHKQVSNEPAITKN